MKDQHHQIQNEMVGRVAVRRIKMRIVDAMEKNTNYGSEGEEWQSILEINIRHWTRESEKNNSVNQISYLKTKQNTYQWVLGLRPWPSRQIRIYTQA